MKLLTNTFLVLCIFILFQCKNSKQTVENEYQSIAEQKLGSDVQYAANGDGSLMLCYRKQSDESRSGRGVVFFVFDNNTKKVIHEDVIDKGMVSWHSDNELALYYAPGTMRTDQSADDYTYIYHLISKEKILKTKL